MEVEITSIDMRFEHTRFKDAASERKLAASIMERDILEPLQVIVNEPEHRYILLDGFKRYRCAKKLEKGIVPVEQISDDIVTGILVLLRRNNSRGLTTMEQAALIDELHNRYGLRVQEIAMRLEHSCAWVSVRLNMINEMSDLIRQKIMDGALPARAYMYGIRSFTRVKRVSGERVDDFVKAVSGKGLSTRELFFLARAYFTGGTAIERVILEGDVHRALKLVMEDTDPVPTLDTDQQEFIKDLRSAAISMRRVTANADTINTVPASGLVQVNLWSNTILANLNDFTKTIKDIYDRSGPPRSGTDTVQSGDSTQSDSTTPQN
jgi:ParB/RepB/Spo0J family partition protein